MLVTAAKLLKLSPLIWIFSFWGKYSRLIDVLSNDNISQECHDIQYSFQTQILSDMCLDELSW